MLIESDVSMYMLDQEPLKNKQSKKNLLKALFYLMLLL